MAGLAGAVTSCGSEGGADKLGGQGDSEPVTLVFANPSIGVPTQLRVFADEVSNRSGGSITVEVRDGWHRGDPEFESTTVADVRSGEVDMAWVGARIFDELGVTSFQALVAPLLVDTHDVQAAVFRDGVPDEMLRQVAHARRHRSGGAAGPDAAGARPRPSVRYT